VLDPITLKPGKEQYEEYASNIFPKRNLVQYDYRDEDGTLFSTVAGSLEEARAQKNQWLRKKGAMR